METIQQLLVSRDFSQDKLIPLLRTAIDNDTLDTIANSLQHQSLSSHSNQITDSAVDKLNVVATQSNQLKVELVSLGQQLNDVTLSMVDLKQRLQVNKETHEKIVETTEIINQLLTTLELFNECHSLIKEEKFFSALSKISSLEKMKTTYLTSFYTTIPHIKTEIKEESINLIKKTFPDRVLYEIGLGVYNHYEKFLSQWQTSAYKYKFNSPVEISMRQGQMPSAAEFYNFNHLHDAILIFTKLDELPYLVDEFNKEYESRVAKMFNVDNITNLSEFLIKLVGFLVFDKHLSSTTLLHSLPVWDSLMTKLGPQITSVIQSSSEAELVQLKDCFGLVMAIAENLGYKPTSHLDTIYQRVTEMRRKQFLNEFRKLLDADDFRPLTVTDYKQFEYLKKLCWLDTKCENVVGFSITLPFSALFPSTCELLETMQQSQKEFTAMFYNIEPNVDDYMQCVVSMLNETLNSTSRSEEIAQLMINLDYFIEAARHLSPIMTQKFIQCRKYAEEQLFKLIDRKVSDLMEFVEIDWTSRQEQEPDFYIKDIATYLDMMFNSTLVALPEDVKTLLVFREFDHLADILLKLIYNARTITKQSVKNFNKSILIIEETFSRISDQAWQTTFVDVKQTVALLQSDSTEYSQNRMRKYDRIKPELAGELLRKVV